MLVHMPEKQPPPPLKKSDEAPPSSPSTAMPEEYDRRGVKLPARTLVGGIITPI